MGIESDFDEDKVYDTVLPFRVLRNVHHSEDGTYHVQMNLKAGMDQDYAEEVIDLLDGLGLLEPVPGTDPMLYEVRYEGLVDAWSDLWEEEVDGIPVTPEDFDLFLERYVKSYLDTERNSTIREMLVKNFFWGLKTLELSKEDEFLDTSIEEFESRLENRYESQRHAHEHIQEALGFREDKRNEK
ncbi:MAG: hypothetical protein ABEJ87_02190 [Candidatus Nanohalobium sp.]